MHPSSTPGVSDFTDLRVYRESVDLAQSIYNITNEWPAKEKYRMTDQILRSSRSVCANIGEAWFKRAYPKHFASKLSDATSEAAETIVWIHLAQRSSLLDAPTANALEARYRKTIGGLSRMIQDAETWCNW